MITLATALALAAGLAAPESAPPVQRPARLTAEPAPEPPPADVLTETPSEEVVAEPTPAPAEPAPEVVAEPAPEPTPAEPAPEVAAEPEAEVEADDGAFRVATERSGPPYYTEDDLAQLRARYGMEPNPPAPRAGARWRCLIADPTCRNTVEVQTMGAYAFRARQGAVNTGEVDRWHSARAQYDVWVGLPALVETVGKARYTRMSMGPKGGVIFSDTGDLWGNVGMNLRYWLGRGRWAPHIEITSALSFKLATRQGNDVMPEAFRMKRGPVGFSADVGFGLGGFGSIVIGGQYDSPLAREDIPEEYREVSSGMFYFGFRGNILWGGPAAAAVAAHASTRAVERP